MHARRAEIAPRVARQAAFAGAAAVSQVFDAAREAPQPAWSLLYYALWRAARIEGRPFDGDIGQTLAG